jgi:hypothetical protein
MKGWFAYRYGLMDLPIRLERTMRYLYLMFIPALMLAGCYTIIDGGDPPPLNLDLSTPGRTLESLARVWNTTRNTDDYSRLLSTDYHFYFAPGDVGKHLKDGYIIPPSWDKAEDMQATSNVFAQASRGGPYDISMDILNSGDYDFDPGGTDFTAEAVQMQVYIWPEGPDFAYLATGSFVFDFKKIDGLWLISGWHDSLSNDGSISLIGDQVQEGALGVWRAYYHP